MDDYAEVRSVKVLHELGLTEDMVRDHVIRPERVNAAALRIELRDAGDGDDDRSNPPPSGLFYNLNVQKLSRDLHDLLSGCVVGYPFPASVPGWSSDDLSTMSGCVGWHLSVDDLLTVMAAFRRRGIIVDTTRAQTMLDRQFGLDVKRDTPLGRIYAKGGF